MRVAVPQFWGSNCDQDALHSLRDDLGVQASYVWYEETSLTSFDGVFIPGGFSYGDYLRCGAIAARAPVMDAIRDMAHAGAPILGVCNGFQILCEAALLPGALLRNESQRFSCRDVFVRAAQQDSLWTRGIEGVLRLPIAHMDGRYVCDAETLRELRAEHRIAYVYCTREGRLDPAANPNGSLLNVAGILNVKGNVLGMMPHPERATRKPFGYEDGLRVLSAFTRANIAV